jgi:glyoxylase-like metal-dependent hydrolase (beta-lactamase superfamily II)
LELKQIKGNTWCLMGHQLMPVYRLDAQRCILIDPGTALPKVRSSIEAALAQAGLTPVGVLCTHSHYDHVGNASYFKEKYGIPVAMPIGEAEQCRTAFAVKSYLYVFTPGQVQEDETMRAIPCYADQVIGAGDDSVNFCGVTFGVLHTPGHSIDHVSLITPDNVCYVGDALMSGGTLRASKLPYAYHMSSYLRSLELLRTVPCEQMIIAHGGVVEAPFDALIDENIEAPLATLGKLSTIVNRPMTMDEISVDVRAAMGIEVNTVEKALSFERFLRPYLECMVDHQTHILTLKNGILAYAPASYADV